MPKTTPGDTAVGQNAGQSSGYTGNSAQASGIANIPEAAQTMFAPLLAQGWTQAEITAAVQHLPAAEQAQIVSQGFQTANAIYNPDTTFDKVMQDIALAGSVAGIGLATGGILAPAIAAGAGVTGAAAGGGGVAGSVGTGIGAIGASAAAGSVGGALTSALEGQNIGKGALVGAVSGGLGQAAAPLTSTLQDAGLSKSAAGALVKGGVGATTGALGAELTGGNVGESALLGGASGAIKGGVQGSGLQQSITDTTGSSLVGGAATGLATGALTGIAGSTLTSSSGKSATSASQLAGDSGTSSSESSGSNNQFEASTELSPGVSPVSTPNPMAPAVGNNIQNLSGATSAGSGISATPTSTAPSATAPASSSFLSDVGTGLASTLGGSSLGTDLGTLLPYAGVAAVGEAQASAGQAKDAQAAAQQQALAAPAIAESGSLANQYNTGTLNSADQAVVSTGIAQGQSTIASANGLSSIAQTAFSNYNNGTLTAGDQAALDANTAAQKSAVAQQLSAAGITDSTILAGQYQQIDNQALISKQNTLNGYFNTGNAAYNSWLTATTEGQQTITAAQTYASTSLNTYLANSMAEANIGMGEVNTAIQTQMTTDANYAAQVSQLMGTLATAYAKQIAGQKAGGTTATNALGSAAKGAASGATGATGALPTTGFGNSGAPTSMDIGNSTQDAGIIDTSSLDSELQLDNQMPDMDLGLDDYDLTGT